MRAGWGAVWTPGSRIPKSGPRLEADRRDTRLRNYIVVMVVRSELTLHSVRLLRHETRSCTSIFRNIPSLHFLEDCISVALLPAGSGCLEAGYKPNKRSSHKAADISGASAAWDSWSLAPRCCLHGTCVPHPRNPFQNLCTAWSVASLQKRPLGTFMFGAPRQILVGFCELSHTIPKVCTKNAHNLQT